MENAIKFLYPLGVLQDQSIQYEGPLDQYILLNGDQDEIYTYEEINFIKSISNIIVFTSYYKRSSKGLIECRVVAVFLNENDESISTSVLIEKIINKAFNCFNIFMFNTWEGLVFGMTTFDGTDGRGYLIKEPINAEDKYEALAEYAMYVPDDVNFVEYYMALYDLFRINAFDYADIDEKIKKRRCSKSQYINDLYDISNMCELDFSFEIERFYNSFESNISKNFEDIVLECEMDLFPVVSLKSNSFEVLFDAEEMESLELYSEKKSMGILNEENDNKEIFLDDDTVHKMLQNPEDMIKIIKNKKGV